MFSVMPAAVVVSAGMIFTALPCPVTGVVDQGPGYQAGYEAVDAAGFRMARTTFTVPDAGVTGQAGLDGMYLTDTNAGRAAGCGWVGARMPDGVVGCFDEADTSSGWVTLLANVSPDARVTVTMRYKANGRMTVTAADAGTAASESATFSGVSGETWNQALAGAVPSATIPSTATTLAVVSNTRLALMSGRAAPLPSGPWTINAVIVTSNGQSSGQVIAAPTRIKRNAFSVMQHP
jgi:hypothetical protein